MANTQKDQDCNKDRLKAIKNVFAAAASAVWSALCQALKAALAAVRTALQAQLSVLPPILELEEVFLQSFVIFPADTVEKTVGAVSSAFNTVRDFGLDEKCSAQKTMSDQVKKTGDKQNAVLDFFRSVSRVAKKEIEDSKERIANLEEAIATITAYIDIECQ